MLLNQGRETRPFTFGGVMQKAQAYKVIFD